MTKEQALEILIKATSVYRGTREEHQVILQAIEIIKKELNKDVGKDEK
jgi:hypothetical protein